MVGTPEHESLPMLKVLLVLPYEPHATFMVADMGILRKHFDLDTLTHSRGKRYLFLTAFKRLVLRRPDVLLMWFIVPSYALPLTIMAKLSTLR